MQYKQGNTRKTSPQKIPVQKCEEFVLLFIFMNIFIGHFCSEKRIASVSIACEKKSSSPEVYAYVYSLPPASEGSSKQVHLS